jgi:tight adherence protein B
MMLVLITVLFFLSAYLLVRFFVEFALPRLIAIYTARQSKKTDELARKLEESFIFWEKNRLMLLYLAPFVFGAAAFLLFRHIIFVILGFLLGFGFPAFMVRLAHQRRIKKFQSQLVDGLMILASSLKAGLSFVQAIEVLCEELPPPISQEFNLVLKENRWGLSLDESLKRLRQRLPLEEVNLMVSSILIARESGGELPKVFSRLTNTIRDNLKLKEKIATLTLQGRLQGLIMMFLPVGFAYFVYKQNPEHFLVMWQSQTGRMLLFLAVGLQVVGMFFIKRISTMRF